MKYLSALFFTVVCVQLVSAQNQNKQLDSIFTKRYQEGAFNGNVLIADKGKIIFEKSYGLANEESKIPLNSASIFNLASLSKQFTAMAIVLLKNQGKLTLEDPLSKYIPELGFYKNVSIKNLLVHTSGLPDYMTLMEKKWDKSKIANNSDVINLMAAERPMAVFEPNEKFSYSNTGYVLLASIIERVSKQSYAEFLKQYIFSPCKMKNTAVVFRYLQKSELKNLTEAYIIDSLGNKIKPELTKNSKFAVYLDGVYGQGRVFSTTIDLLKWDRILYTEKLVSKADKQLIFSSIKLNNGDESDYGFGWMINNNKLYGQFVYHSGSWPGYATFIERHLINDKTVIILQNNTSSKTTMSILNVRKLIYGLPIENRIDLPTAVMNTFVGKYKSLSGQPTEITLIDDKLFILMNGKVKLELIPLSKNRFLVDGFSPDVTYEFLSDEKGSVIKYVMQQPEMGIRKEAVKI